MGKSKKSEEIQHNGFPLVLSSAINNTIAKLKLKTSQMNLHLQMFILLIISLKRIRLDVKQDVIGQITKYTEIIPYHLTYLQMVIV